MTLPLNPDQQKVQAGKDFLLKINKGTTEIPVWVPVGAQRGTDIERTAEEIDASHKTSGGWKVTLAGLRGWTMSAEALVILNDEGQKICEQAFNQGAEVNVQFLYPDGSYFTGWGYITAFNLSAAHTEVATLSITISGSGPLSDLVTPVP